MSSSRILSRVSNSFVNRMIFLLKVSLCSHCETDCGRFPSAPLMSHCFDFLSELRCWLPQSVDNFWNFVCARVYPNQHLKVLRAWHFHINARPSFFVENIDSFDWSNSASRTDSSEYTSTCLTGGSVNFSAHSALSGTVSCWPCFKVFPDLQEFCVVRIFSQSNEHSTSAFTAESIPARSSLVS